MRLLHWALIALLPLYFYFAYKYFASIGQINTLYIPLLFITTITFFLFQGVLLKVSLLPFGVTLVFREWFGLMILTLCANYALPFSGIGFRLAYLRARHGLSYSAFIGSLACICIIEIFVFCLGGIIAILYISQLSEFRNQVTFAVFFFLCVGAVAFLPLKNWLMSYSFFKKPRLELALNGIDLISKSGKPFKLLILFTTIEYLIYSLSFYSSLKIIDLQVDFISSFLIASLSDISFFLRVAPGALGTYEASMVYASLLLNLDAVQGLVIAMLTRAASITWFLALGPLAFLLLVKPNQALIGHQEDQPL